MFAIFLGGKSWQKGFCALYCFIVLLSLYAHWFHCILESAAGRQPLNPALPRRAVVVAKHTSSFSYPGARPCCRPSSKSFRLLSLHVFGCSGLVKRCQNSIMRFGGTCWTLFAGFLLFFWCLPSAKTLQFTLFLCLWHEKRSSCNMLKTA